MRLVYFLKGRPRPFAFRVEKKFVELNLAARRWRERCTRVCVSGGKKNFGPIWETKGRVKVADYTRESRLYLERAGDTRNLGGGGGGGIQHSDSLMKRLIIFEVVVNEVNDLELSWFDKFKGISYVRRAKKNVS